VEKKDTSAGSVETATDRENIKKNISAGDIGNDDYVTTLKLK